jgi:hypothetical protein
LIDSLQSAESERQTFLDNVALDLEQSIAERKMSEALLVQQDRLLRSQSMTTQSINSNSEQLQTIPDLVSEDAPGTRDTGIMSSKSPVSISQPTDTSDDQTVINQTITDASSKTSSSSPFPSISPIPLVSIDWSPAPANLDLFPGDTGIMSSKSSISVPHPTDTTDDKTVINQKGTDASSKTPSSSPFPSISPIPLLSIDWPPAPANKVVLPSQLSVPQVRGMCSFVYFDSEYSTRFQHCCQQEIIPFSHDPEKLYQSINLLKQRVRLHLKNIFSMFNIQLISIHPDISLQICQAQLQIPN